MVSKPAPHQQWNARRLAGFIAGFGALIILAELLLRLTGWLQGEIGWALLDRDVPEEAAQLVAALAGSLLAMTALVSLFAVAEWRHLRFARLLPRYGEGLLYTATALVLASLIQTGAFAGLTRLGFAPLLRAEELGPALVVLPFAYMIGIGFFEYWLHRALHGVPLLWRLHAIHHQIEGLNAARSYSHWAQDALYFAVITVPIALLIDQPQPHVTLVTSFYLVSNYYMHSDSPGLSFPPWLRHVLADNVYHHHHHARAVEHWGRNYCSFFSFYDRLFGTQHMPGDETFPATGIEGYRPLSGWRDYLVRPFMRDPRAGAEPTR
ncbi:sterol desaturase family protein [Erythrobacter sp. CCH5-A1]|uniref:sterol desaturase family protein n=1 Tax=Erythrobacter sp. CCH5-A1 TaxID=1768792 RepID=UPI00082DE954|nr:sterol desaturase family protein [Erythrobacter sp. CCH5-A1]